MSRIFRFSALCGVLFLVGIGSAQAQTKPFFISGSGTADYIPLNPGAIVNHNITKGNATLMGKHTGAGKYEVLSVGVDPDTGLPTEAFQSANDTPFVFTGANGDKLAFHYGNTNFGADVPGHAILIPAEGGLFVAHFFAEFVPVPAACTGRFANVTSGSVWMIAVSKPFQPGPQVPTGYSWTGVGTLTFGNP